MRPSLHLSLLVAVSGSLACGPHLTAVQADALQLRYAQPAPARIAETPIALVYDPRELPDDVPLAVPDGFPHSSVHHARAMVTKHLRSALETMVRRVEVVDDPSRAPAGAAIATVHFVEVGVTVSGLLPVGTLEWSLALCRSGESRPFYSWAERTVGTRGAYGSFGTMDAAPLVQGALEASLRGLLNDIKAHGVLEQLGGT
jgi:hypothetical protein